MTLDEFVVMNQQENRDHFYTVTGWIASSHPEKYYCFRLGIMAGIAISAKRCEDFGKTLEVDISDCFAEEIRRE